MSPSGTAPPLGSPPFGTCSVLSLCGAASASSAIAAVREQALLRAAVEVVRAPVERLVQHRQRSDRRGEGKMPPGGTADSTRPSWIVCRDTNIYASASAWC